MNQKQVLLNRIRVCDFVLTESALYLDTHPTDAEAFTLYQSYAALLEQGRKAFLEQIGPLNQTDSALDSSYTWVCSPLAVAKSAKGGLSYVQLSENAAISSQNRKPQSEAGLCYHQPVRWSGRRIGRFHALSLPKILPCPTRRSLPF